jgi:hypothetical protein
MSIRSLAAGAVLGAGLVAAVGMAYASIPDSSGVIHACYQNVTSANKPVKLLNTSQKTACPSGWLPVSWNQQGIQGPPGTNGVSGYQLITAAGTVSANTGATVTAQCPGGKHEIGGGYEQTPNPGQFTTDILAVTGSYPTSSSGTLSDEWAVDVPDNTTGSAKTVDVYVECAATS